jgi:hypothetical protein
VVIKFGRMYCLPFQDKCDNISVYHSIELRVGTPQATALLISLCLAKFRFVGLLGSLYFNFNFK